MGARGLVEWEIFESLSFIGYISDTVAFVGKMKGTAFITQKRISPSRFDSDYVSKLYMISKGDYEAANCDNIDCIANSDPSKNLFDDNTYYRNN